MIEQEEGIKLEDVSGGPYNFRILDGRDENGKKKYLTLELEDWTIDSEKWAKKHYGSMQKLFNTLMHIECEDEETIDAAMAVAEYKLTDHSRRLIEERRGDKTTAEYLANKLSYKLLAECCMAEYEMIKDSIPVDALKKTQEILMVMNQEAMKKSTSQSQ